MAATQNDRLDPFRSSDALGQEDEVATDSGGVYVSPSLAGGPGPQPWGTELDEATRPTLPDAMRASVRPGEGESRQPAEAVEMKEAEPPGILALAIGAGRLLDEKLRREMSDHPYASLIAAMALGYAVRTERIGKILALAGGRFALQAMARAMTPEST
jgi:hypothetical protein